MAGSLHLYNYTDSYLCQILKSLMHGKTDSSNNSYLNKISVSLIFDMKGCMPKNKREKETD